MRLMPDDDLNLGDHLGVPREFWPPGYSKRICDEILPEHERASILEAAYMAHEGYDLRAELIRREGGYDYEARKVDRHRRGLPRRL